MGRWMTGLVLLVALAGPATAEVLSPEAFEALAEGRTLYFTQGGARYGEEQYLPGRRSLWRYEDGSCSSGAWWGEGEAICFGYEDAPGPQCWRFTRGKDGVAAELVEGGVRTGVVVEMSRADTAPLPCIGPYLGT